jgi:hypothetical protein
MLFILGLPILTSHLLIRFLSFLFMWCYNNISTGWGYMHCAHTQLQLLTMSGCWEIRKCCLYWGSIATSNIWFRFLSCTFMWCYNVVQAEVICIVPHTQLQLITMSSFVEKSKMLFIPGLLATSNISWFRFLNTSCGAITWYRLRLYALCRTHSYSS